jgi:manganese/zinc/iron transport system permease protein
MNIFHLLHDANTQWVLAGTLLLGMASGVLGSFAYLKKQSLIGDAMAHAALPGICMAFIIYGQKSMIWFFTGAAFTGLLATYFIQAIVKNSRIKEDTSIALVLSVFFGIGIVLLTYINQNGSGNQSGLDDYIFGQAASLVGNDVKIITFVAIILLAVTATFFKEFKLLTFDPQFAEGIGLPTRFLNGMLMFLIVSTVMIGLQAVGVILMAAMLITPALAARYWTERLDRMVIIAGGIGALSGVIGTILSTASKGLPTGPLIIIAATLIFLFSMVFAPKRGLMVKMIKLTKMRKQTARENIILSLFDLMEEVILKQQTNQHSMGFSEEQIRGIRPVSKKMFDRIMKQLLKENMIVYDERLYYLTEQGKKLAYQLTLKNRLMEVYKMYEMKFSHEEVEKYENIFELPEPLLRELYKYLHQLGRMPVQLSTVETSKNQMPRNNINGRRRASSGYEL